MKVRYRDENQVKEIIKAIELDGHGNLHILSDFDRTLTYGTINGIKTPSIISMLRDGQHLTERYAARAHALFDTYHPIEIDPHVSLDEKKRAMHEWWDAHNLLLIESGLTISDLKDIVDKGHLRFREGVSELLDMLNARKIPLVIISASGCGDAIRLFFQKHGKDYPNISYIVNRFEWDEQGRACFPKEPIIHSLNKNETTLAEIPEVYEKVKNRKNVILMGDSVGDADMIAGFSYNNLLKIGFLNREYNKDRENFMKHFDVVLAGDGDMRFVYSLIKQICDNR